jgi:hypothetical protein
VSFRSSLYSEVFQYIKIISPFISSWQTRITAPKYNFDNNLSSETTEARSEKDETGKDTTTEANTSDSAATKTEDEACKENTSAANTTTAETSDTTTLTETSESTQSADDKN